MSKQCHLSLHYFYSVSLALALLLSVSLDLAALAQPVPGQPVEKGAIQKKMPAVAQRDFLPPVANINPKIAEHELDTDISLEPVALSAVTSPTVTLSPKVKNLTLKLNASASGNTEAGTLKDFQKQMMEADLELLWTATVEKNPVVQFSLQKMSMPQDLKQKKSSQFLSKTLNVLISGAAMGSTVLPGGGAYRNMGTMAVSNALQNMVTDPNGKVLGSLTPTEQIQLAGLIDLLKQELITNYHSYRKTLQELSANQEELLLYKTQFNNARFASATGQMNTLATGMTYYQALLNETKQRQMAKLFRLKLERLAGLEAVKKLSMGTLSTDQTESAVIGPLPDTLSEESTKAQLANLSPPPRKKPVVAPLVGPELPEFLEIGPKLTEMGSPVSLSPSVSDSANAAKKPKQQPVLKNSAPKAHTPTNKKVSNRSASSPPKTSISKKANQAGH